MSFNPNSTGAKLELNGSTSGEISQFASASTTSYSLTWPAAQAASSGYVLINDGSGNLTWGPQTGAGGVTTLNTLSGAVTISAGSNITLTPSGNNISIASSGGGGGVSSFNSQTGSITISGTGGTTVSNVGTAFTINSSAGGSGTVTSVSVVSANGFAGTVATATTTPAITMSTTVSGILFGNGTSVAAAIPSNFPILNQNTTGNAATATTATTNANLTGVVTSVGNTTSIANGAITNAMLATSYNVETFTLGSGDITNGYVTLSPAPDVQAYTILTVIGGPMQSYGSDYTIVGGDRLTWAGNLAANLVAGDMLVVQYN